MALILDLEQVSMILRELIWLWNRFVLPNCHKLECGRYYYLSETRCMWSNVCGYNSCFLQTNLHKHINRHLKHVFSKDGEIRQKLLSLLQSWFWYDIFVPFASESNFSVLLFIHFLSLIETSIFNPLSFTKLSLHTLIILDTSSFKPINC